MYADWFCLLGIKTPNIYNKNNISREQITNLFNFISSLNYSYYKKYYFVPFGEINNSIGGIPDEILLKKLLSKIALKFPYIEIRCFLSFLNGHLMKLYILRNGLIIEKNINLNIEIDKNEMIKIPCDINSFNPPNNITQFVNKNYKKIYPGNSLKFFIKN